MLRKLALIRNKETKLWALIGNNINSTHSRREKKEKRMEKEEELTCNVQPTENELNPLKGRRK